MSGASEKRTPGEADRDRVVFDGMTLEQLAERYGTVSYRGKVYTLIQDVFFNDETDVEVFMALSVLGPEEDGRVITYPVLWKVVDIRAEEFSDVCDWEHPWRVIGHTD